MPSSAHISRVIWTLDGHGPPPCGSGMPATAKAIATNSALPFLPHFTNGGPLCSHRPDFSRSTGRGRLFSKQPSVSGILRCSHGVCPWLPNPSDRCGCFNLTALRTILNGNLQRRTNAAFCGGVQGDWSFHQRQTARNAIRRAPDGAVVGLAAESDRDFGIGQAVDLAVNDDSHVRAHLSASLSSPRLRTACQSFLICVLMDFKTRLSNSP